MFLKSGLWTMTHEQTKFNSNNSIETNSPMVPAYFYSFEFESEYNTLYDWIFMGHLDMPVVAGMSSELRKFY